MHRARAGAALAADDDPIQPPQTIQVIGAAAWLLNSGRSVLGPR
jgi:hypothetical protein